MHPLIKTVIYDQYQTTIDGYLYRLQNHPEIQIAACCLRRDDLDEALKAHQPQVLILGLEDAGEEPGSPSPERFLLTLLKDYPRLHVLLITGHQQAPFPQKALQAGVRGYIFRDDPASLRDLPAIIHVLQNGVYVSKEVCEGLWSVEIEEPYSPLTCAEVEALSLCAAYPHLRSAELAVKMNVAQSTIRNTLSNAYRKLGVNTRTDAVRRASQLGLLAHDLA